MKIFWRLLIAGFLLIGLSSLWSFLGDAASQRNDFGVIAGSLLALVLIAAAIAWSAAEIKRFQGRSNPKDKS